MLSWWFLDQLHNPKIIHQIKIKQIHSISVIHKWVQHRCMQGADRWMINRSCPPGSLLWHSLPISWCQMADNLSKCRLLSRVQECLLRHMGMTPLELLQERGNGVTLCTITLLIKQSASYKQLTESYTSLLITLNTLPRFLNFTSTHFAIDCNLEPCVASQISAVTTSQIHCWEHCSHIKRHWIRKNKLTLTKGHTDHPDGHIFS